MNHILLRCKLAEAVWTKVGLKDLAISSTAVQDFFSSEQPRALHGKLWHVFFAACAVALWNAWNAQAFKGESWRQGRVFSEIAALITLWSMRAPEDTTREALRTWANVITST